MALGILAGVVMIGVLVFIHEFGHFIVAKLFKVGVPVFSIGMGPRLFGFYYKGTDYRVSALPVGGYVQLAGADPFGDADPESYVDPDEDFMRKPVWQRLLVMFAGPAFNLALPFVLFTAVLMGGEPQADSSIGSVLPGTPLEQVGGLDGDVVVAIDGEPVEVWADIHGELQDRLGRPVTLTVDRAGERVDLALPAGAVKLMGTGMIDTEGLGIGWQRRSSRIGIDDPASPAGQAGLQTGDAITKVDGVDVDTWNELVGALTGERHELEVLRAVRLDDGSVKTSTVQASLARDPEWAPREGDAYADPWGLLPIVLFVGAVTDDAPAARAGIRADDRIYAIGGVQVRGWTQLVEQIAVSAEPTAKAAPAPLAFVLVRAGETIDIEVTPEMHREIVISEVRYRPAVGITQYPSAFVDGPFIAKYYSFAEALPRASEESVMLFKHTLTVLGSLFTGEIKPQESLGGPIEIFRMAADGAREGIFSFARRVGMISISLGIINLLPVPVLDGGQILFYLVEAVRGRPLSVQIREKLQMAGVLALVALMLMVAVFDVNRWLTGG